MKEKEFRHIQELYIELAEQYDIELEDTDYYENGTFPTSLRKEKQDQKNALRLLSRALEEHSEFPITELETWREDYDHADKRSRNLISRL